MEVMDTQALEQFHSVMATKPSRQASKAFLLRKATQFLGQTPTGAKSRQERRQAARMVAKRLSKKVRNGEDII